MSPPITLELELQPAIGQRSQPRRGHSRCEDVSLYEFHEEVPFEGMGVPFDRLLVVERSADGRETKFPYRHYFSTAGREARCPLCNRNTITTPSCRAARRNSRRAAALIKLEQYREQWAIRSPSAGVPLEAAERDEAHPLMGRLPDLDTAQRIARRFDYDYSGLHIVPHRDHFRLFACAFKEVLGAGADAISCDAARAWPGPRVHIAPRGPCLSDYRLRGSPPEA